MYGLNLSISMPIEPVVLTRIQIIYSGFCILRTPVQSEKYGLKFEMLLKWKDIYIENIIVMSLMDGFKMKGIVK